MKMSIFEMYSNGGAYTYTKRGSLQQMHHLELVDRSIHPTQEVLPMVISGENACPPEDCGGILGYKELLEVLKNPKHPEYGETKVWVGSKFNPTNFCVYVCNKVLGKLNKYMKEYEEGF